jgi:hypothetical protein
MNVSVAALDASHNSAEMRSTEIRRLEVAKLNSAGHGLGSIPNLETPASFGDVLIDSAHRNT